MLRYTRFPERRTVITTKMVPIENLVEELRRMPVTAFLREAGGALSSTMARAKSLTVLIAMLTLLVVACNQKKDEPETTTVEPSHRVAPSPVGTSQTVLEKTFALKTTEVFPFEIPAHAALPHLHGIFESFVGQVHRASDDSANIDFLIMNEDQQANFVGNRPSEALFSVEGSHNQAVNFDLPGSLNEPVKYYLVFRNPEGSRARKTVEANFRVDF